MKHHMLTLWDICSSFAWQIWQKWVKT